MSSFLSIRKLAAGYGRSQVLFDVDLDIPSRGGTAVLGRNGAGKTTLLKAIVGDVPAWKGTISLKGNDLSRRPTEDRVHGGIGYVPQEHSVFAGLSVRDNLAIGTLLKRDPSAVDRVLATFPKLGKRLDQAAGTLSGGERKMLAIARALLGDPKLLLLDEPTEGVWIGVIEEIIECLTDLAKRIAVVVVEQHLDLAIRVADHAFVLDRGRIALQGGAQEVRSNPELMRYLAP
ncbi:ABC transporter ATP-binding protein [Mesorhizobium sp.]|uniref:ABC transporter ATP-binding protein n=1 Tax=Mesorhizobium sp. TaxID=1871066 RepID=UPI000FEA575D|nr:ABC transporter ATP-binding protein [Mesorhizobium sp.]RWG06109.1 MAG: ABC transporter ATP-binding protein [Mesorhizobium sp.]TIR90681.1 MAG: ABC transporter ATP-binding protein [Mesorhizobium sp.]